MRKLILSVALLATMTVSQAQEKSETVKFGAKAGLNLSSASVKNSIDSDINVLTGFYLGGFVSIPVASKFTFQPELLYSMQGYKEYLNDRGNIFDAKVELNYISVPMVFQYNFVDKFYAEVGPQLDVLMSAKASQTSTYVSSNTTKTRDDIDVKEFYKSFVVGVDLGVGYHITDNVFANVRYHLGVSNSLDSEETKVKQRVLQIGLGYSF
jgi:outer membrane immunogenic protein